MDVGAILSIILGSFLGFGATLLSARLASYSDDKAKKRSHAQYLRLELEGSIKSLDEIRTAYEHQHFYDFLLIDLLDSYVNNLQDARKQGYLIRDEKLQSQVFAIINRISLLAKDMRGIQLHVYTENETTDQKTGQKRTMNATELADKQNLIRDKVQAHLMEILDLKREVKAIAEELNDIK